MTTWTMPATTSDAAKMTDDYAVMGDRNDVSNAIGQPRFNVSTIDEDLERRPEEN